MHERERLEDFRGGGVACRGCHRILMFHPDKLMALSCCGFLYRPEPGPLDLVIYDRVGPAELEGALVIPAPGPTVVTASPEDVLLYTPAYGDTASLDMSEVPGMPEDYGDAGVSEVDVDTMVASAQEIEERKAERNRQLEGRRPPGRPPRVKGLNYNG
jgi:hypothetical protein